MDPNARANGTGARQAAAPTAADEQDAPRTLEACTCGHDLADHLLDNGGAVCKLTPTGQCTCVHFSFAPQGARTAPITDDPRESAAGGTVTEALPLQRQPSRGGGHRRLVPLEPTPLERGGGRDNAGPGAIASVLTWLRWMEVTDGPPPRARLVRVYGQLWSARAVGAVVARILAAGYATEDATGLHLTDAGRHHLAEQAERQRRGPR